MVRYIYIYIYTWLCAYAFVRVLVVCFRRQENGDEVADNLEPTYFFNTAAQLLVSDSLEPVEAGVGRAARRIRQGRGGDSLSAPLACRSR